jgi:hypothetical protein
MKKNRSNPDSTPRFGVSISGMVRPTDVQMHHRVVMCDLEGKEEKK